MDFVSIFEGSPNRGESRCQRVEQAACIIWLSTTAEKHNLSLQHTTNVVLTLMHPLENLGYDLYTDRFYTSPALATKLLQRNKTLTGTVMRNRKEMPAAGKTKKNRERRCTHLCQGKDACSVDRQEDYHCSNHQTPQLNGDNSIKISMKNTHKYL